MGEWFQEFFSGLYTDVLAGLFDEQTTLAQARTVKRLLRLRKGRSVLDVPCGMGRLSIPLAQMGLEVTGVDLTARYIHRARRNGSRAGVAVDFVCRDMRALDYAGVFDGAFNWFGSFGYFSDADNLLFCKAVYRALKPGGLFLIEGINKPWLLDNFVASSESAVGRVTVKQKHRWDPESNRMLSTWRIATGKTVEKHRVIMRIFDGAEIRRLLRKAGFTGIVLHTNPPGKPFTRRSRRFIVVAGRPR
ncbi:MAG: class I SAM-dependent methyltransferase [Planctomycetes bacterium]|nr:class I SAM-dependent methyltransferase [Planctomycetota bacterium]